MSVHDPELNSPDAAADALSHAATAFFALGSEARLSIVLRLVRAGTDGMATGDLGEAVGITGSVLTHHMKHLKAAGLVHQRKDGRRIISLVDHQMIGDLSDFLLAECCVDQNAPEDHVHG